MQIELTGADDREGPWKLAVAGAAGSGKTMLSSTAPEPLFVFFQQEPRIKSVADRSIPHVKIVNDFTSRSYALDQLHNLVMHLSLQSHKFETLVIDTGDELFQQMKAGRADKNGGEFNVGDWAWIQDAYREVMLSLIDLPMHIIVTYHTKLSTVDDMSVRELALQGGAKDEAAGWFDIVGVLEGYEVVNENGVTVTRRNLVTGQSRLYPWVKDHSGALPARFELSPGITNDFGRILELVSTSPSGTSERQVIAEVPEVEAAPPSPPQDIPSPEELDSKKIKSQDPEVEPQVETPAPRETSAPIDNQDTQPPSALSENDGPITTGSASVDTVPDTVGSQDDVESAVADQITHPAQEGASEDERAAALLQEELNTEEVEHNPYVCEVCGVEVNDTDLHELTQIRFQKYLCRPHFKEMLHNK